MGDGKQLLRNYRPPIAVGGRAHPRLGPAAWPRRRPPAADPHRKRRGTLFLSIFRAYIARCRRKPAMAINGRRNKPIGPGGGTRRLHQRGRNRIDEGVKGVLLLGMVPPLSGQTHSCKRQLCSGGLGCVSSPENRIEALTVKLRQAGFGGTWQQKPPLSPRYLLRHRARPSFERFNCRSRKATPLIGHNAIA